MLTASTSKMRMLTFSSRPQNYPWGRVHTGGVQPVQSGGLQQHHPVHHRHHQSYGQAGHRLWGHSTISESAWRLFYIPVLLISLVDYVRFIYYCFLVKCHSKCCFYLCCYDYKEVHISQEQCTEWSTGCSEILFQIVFITCFIKKQVWTNTEMLTYGPFPTMQRETIEK